ncbi:S-adenosylmethionine mitochondrial carrier protein homolog [Tribolium castaneum]|uniref:S-adenosylmethionine mitochondrial carrier protein homolog-like Protein n=1 Tax=Tribolium castaneum TaxID=7070 RepID=D6WVA6_TRICA|nr:PREDICTED: S-adenosylmethionine mitochondrial carrier protein homolog [Tribolium castaneum]EFA09096.1 S-adenosylmethionine mitochondrial carrier protein homolog-like Protein [Tribolium castaneum]|eukprot:XP_975135.1 PREDICTED: S-adenosylmethionine mitochondrial carrier protein homolog [Tribolium castaneum]
MLSQEEKNMYFSSLFGGAVGGLVVDVVLFPLDTLKTRLQSGVGFRKAGGFSGIYKGIGPQAIGSAPQAAFFFLTYESFKYYTEPHVAPHSLPLVYMTGASISEVVACLIRVPMEVVKQRRQTTTNHKHTSLRILKHAIKSEGIIKGLYRGFGSTIIREIPFSLIQFPVLEYLKSTYRINFKNNIPLESWEVANCGAIAGGFAAAVTTPLDVAKTRIMLADKKTATKMRVRSVLSQIYYEQGIKGLFAGFAPRVLWITLGGYVFFGMYDFSKNFCNEYFLDSEFENR